MKNFYSKIKFIFLGLSFAVQAQADTLHLAAAGAAKEFVQKIAPEFKRQTGHDIQATFDTVGAQRSRVEAAARAGQTGVTNATNATNASNATHADAANEKIDMVFLSRAAIVQLQDKNLINVPSITPLGVVQVGFALPKMAPARIMRTPDELKATLLDVASIAYADPARGATAGTHFAKVLQALEIEKHVAHKITVLPFGVDVVQGVADGKFALGVSQSSEIMQHHGVQYSGALPPPFQLSTAYLAAVIHLPNQQVQATSMAAHALIEFLKTPTAQQAMREGGFEKP